MPKMWPQPMKEKSEHQGWNTKEKRCREPACWLSGCRVLHVVSVLSKPPKISEML